LKTPCGSFIGWLGGVANALKHGNGSDPAKTLGVDYHVTSRRAVVQIEDETLTLPTVTSPTATAITDTTASLGGTVTSDGGASITKRGVLYALMALSAGRRMLNLKHGGSARTSILIIREKAAKQVLNPEP
jgi:hypothetical protein